MAKYSPRLTAPSTTNKNYLHYTRGGYNYCIRISGNSCLPNCVGYAWGRWREILGKKHNLSLSNAENWWGHTSDGYKRGQTPKVGAVMCWRKGKAGVASDGAGHVAVVEKVNSDGSVTYSNSNYSGTRFYTRTLKAPYRLGSAYTFQGFIYLPVDFDEPKKETTTTSSTATKKTESFLPSCGYFKKGDKSPNIKKIGSFMLKSFPAYTKTSAVSETYNSYLLSSIKEFQERTKLKVDGYIGAITLAELKKHGFKE